MEKLEQVVGPATPLMQADIDTDQIITRDFCITTSKIGLGKGLFHAWRYREDGAEVPDFALNRPGFRKPRILIAGPNFACGSSREHAVWSIMDFGIQAIVAPGFGPHFYENAFKNGLLPVALPEAQVNALARWADQAQGRENLTVSLRDQVVTAPDGQRYPFTIEADRRDDLLAGLDEIGVTLTHESEIAAFQARDRIARPWVYS